MLLDHVLIAVNDLARAAEGFEDQHGLASIEGGRHPNWGTANRIVPLGETYLELVAVVDDDAARASGFGCWVKREATDGGTLLGWAVRTTELDSVSRRLGLPVESGSRVGRDGRVFRWRTAGVEMATVDHSLPFFIEWGPGVGLPGRSHPVHEGALTQLVIRSDRRRLARWLGEHSMPISVEAGPAAILGLVVEGPRGRTVLGMERL